MRKVLLTVFFGLFACRVLALPADQWDVSAFSPTPHNVTINRGETYTFEPRLQVSGTSYTIPTNSSATLYWTTNNWLTAPYGLAGTVLYADTGRVRVAWSNACDTGANRYDYFIGVSEPGGQLYRIRGQITMAPSPGWSPSTNQPSTVVNYPTFAQTTNIVNSVTGTNSLTNAVVNGVAGSVTGKVVYLSVSTSTFSGNYVSSVNGQTGDVTIADQTTQVYVAAAGTATALSAGSDSNKLAAALTNSAAFDAAGTAAAATNAIDAAFIAAKGGVTNGVFCVGTSVSNLNGLLYIPTNTFGGSGTDTTTTNIARDVVAEWATTGTASAATMASVVTGSQSNIIAAALTNAAAFDAAGAAAGITNGAASGTNLTGSIFTNGILRSLGSSLTPAGTNAIRAAQLTTTWTNQSNSTNWTWTKTATEVTLTAYTGQNAVVIPELLDGLPVTTLGDYLFQAKAITSVSGGRFLQKIGLAAFGACQSLTSLNLPITTITPYPIQTFASCTSLTDVQLDSLTAISDDGVSETFQGCTALRSVSLKSCTSVSNAKNVFTNCPALTAVYWGQNAPSTQPAGFYGASPNVTNYVTNPQATGWSNTWCGRPVVRLALYGNGATLTNLSSSQVTDFTNAVRAAQNAASLPAGALVSTNTPSAGQSFFGSSGTSAGVITGYFATAAGSGDMLISVYDANGAKQVAFTNDLRIVNALTNASAFATAAQGDSATNAQTRIGILETNAVLRANTNGWDVASHAGLSTTAQTETARTNAVDPAYRASSNTLTTGAAAGSTAVQPATLTTSTNTLDLAIIARGYLLPVSTQGLVTAALTNGAASGTNLTGSVFSNGILRTLGSAFTDAGTNAVRAAQSTPTLQQVVTSGSTATAMTVTSSLTMQSVATGTNTSVIAFPVTNALVPGARWEMNAVPFGALNHANLLQIHYNSKYNVGSVIGATNEYSRIVDGENSAYFEMCNRYDEFNSPTTNRGNFEFDWNVSPSTNGPVVWYRPFHHSYIMGSPTVGASFTNRMAYFRFGDWADIGNYGVGSTLGFYDGRMIDVAGPVWIWSNLWVKGDVKITTNTVIAGSLVVSNGLSGAVTATGGNVLTNGGAVAVASTNAQQLITNHLAQTGTAAHSGMATNAGGAGAGYYAMSNGVWTSFTGGTGATGPAGPAGAITNIAESVGTYDNASPITITFTNWNQAYAATLTSTGAVTVVFGESGAGVENWMNLTISATGSPSWTWPTKLWHFANGTGSSNAPAVSKWGRVEIVTNSLSFFACQAWTNVPFGGR